MDSGTCCASIFHKATLTNDLQTPSDDKKSNLVCLDGALQDLGRGGSLATRAMSAKEGDVRVWR